MWLPSLPAFIVTVSFHKRLGGPLANNLFNYRPDTRFVLKIEVEKAYNKADEQIEKNNWIIGSLNIAID